MDLVDFSQQAYEETKSDVMSKIQKAGFNHEPYFIPFSATLGVGLFESSSTMPWYQGPCMVQAFDEIDLPKRHPEKNFRMVISEVKTFFGASERQSKYILCG
jgi:elongation factor 1-alpha